MSGTRRLRGDDGAVLVEFALVAPLLIMLVFGLVDYGRMYNQDNVLIRSVQSAARTGAAQGPDRYADYNVLQSLEASLSAMEGAAIQRVVVFRASSANGQVPAACLTAARPDDLTARGVSTGSGSTAVRCNIYSRSQVEYRGNVLSFFPGTSNCAGGWDASWCPTTRSRGSDTTDPDFLGVYVQVEATALTGIVGLPTASMSSTSVFRLDPCITGVSCGV
jgi:Flp pilus assembly protein TadG